MQIHAELRSMLRKLLTDRLDEEGLQILCFDLSIDYQEIKGNTKAVKVMELLTYVEKRGLVAELVLQLQIQRPDITLPPLTPVSAHQNKSDAGRERSNNKGSRIETAPTSRTSNKTSPTPPIERTDIHLPEMVRMPAGPFIIGITERQAQMLVERIMKGGYNIIDSREARANLRQQLLEEPAREIELPEYAIGMYPITNAEFAQFVDQTKYVTEAEQHRNQRTWRMYAGTGKDRHPVVCVNWYDAQAYCNWLSDITGAYYALPTVEEWTKAAAGTSARLYPWGDIYDPAKCNTAESMAGFETTEVELFPSGRSEYGIYDLVGNVYEWTSTSKGAYKLIMGGSWKMACELYGLTVMGMQNAPLQASDQVGFRCVERPTKKLGM